MPIEDELDGLDDEALHLLVLEGEEVVATCRLRFANGSCKLERMAVGADHRRHGIGLKLLDAADAEARRAGSSEVLLHAQVQTRDFYERGGYSAISDEILFEAGIPHVRMRKRL